MRNSANTQATNSDTQENNKLIAEFMDKDVEARNIAYHSEWSFLKPVVEEIKNKSNYDTKPLFGYAFWNNTGTPENTAEFKAVISFIKWYNANK